MNNFNYAIICLERSYKALISCNEKFDCSKCYYKKYGARCMMYLHKDLLVILRSSLFGCNKIRKKGGKNDES